LRILVTNDDGITAPGMWALAAELQKIAEVYVVAPDREQSGVGTSVTLHRPLRVRSVEPFIKGIDTFAVEGTPGDSVIIALRMLLKDKVDLLMSGINEGSNLGNDVLISGTVGAAFQGYFHGITSLAISVASFKELHFEVASQIAGLIAQQVQAGYITQPVLLNINVPNIPLKEITGIELTRLGEQSSTDASRNGHIETGHDGKRSYYWLKHGAPKWKEGEGTDIWALEHNKISVTPLHNDLTNHEQFTHLQGLRSSLIEGLTVTGSA